MPTSLHYLFTVFAWVTAVLFPVVALSTSTWLEGFVWQPISIIGAVMALAGNLVMFWPMRPAHTATDTPVNIDAD